MPYQLHCCPALLLADDELIELALDDGATLWLDALLDGELLTLLVAEELLLPPEQTAPFNVGISALPPFLFT